MWEDDFPCWGVSQWKQKVSRFGLDKPSRPFQLYYYIFSNNLKPTSQLVKREAISLLTFASHTLCIRSPCLCWWHSRQLSIFRVKFQAAELSVNNFKLSSLSSHLGPLSPSCALLPGSAWACPRGFRLIHLRESIWGLLWRWQTSQGHNEKCIGVCMWRIVEVLDDVIFLQRKLNFLLLPIQSMMEMDLKWVSGNLSISSSSLFLVFTGSLEGLQRPFILTFTNPNLCLSSSVRVSVLAHEHLPSAWLLGLLLLPGLGCSKFPKAENGTKFQTNFLYSVGDCPQNKAGLTHYD